MTARVLPYGPDAVLVELDGGDQVAGVARALRETRLPGVVEIVPGARTVLVRAARGALAVTAIAEVVESAQADAADPDGPVVDVPVRYDGADLELVARESGLSEDEVVRRHCASTYTVAFCGFAPGFAYLTGLDPLLHLPRRREPRARVPTGSVAIASEYTSVYPTASPGGWHLLGRTDLVLWDPGRTPPALLVPGTRVRFIEESA